jgi:hypothetical protein
MQVIRFGQSRSFVKGIHQTHLWDHIVTVFYSDKLNSVDRLLSLRCFYLGNRYNSASIGSSQALGMFCYSGSSTLLASV